MINLPFPSSKLSGHTNGHWRAKAAETAKHRQWAFDATLAVLPIIIQGGDIRVHVQFTPPNNRGDRTNYPNRCKPYFDGIADALGVNDRRFVPSYEFLPPAKPGAVHIRLEAVS